MNAKIKLASAKIATIILIAATTFGAAPSNAAYAQAAIQQSQAIQDVDTAQLSTAIQATSGPIVVEFYDPTDPDTSGECAKQKQIYEDVAAEYAGRITFLRFDIRQDKAMAEAGRLMVCPTHLFILDRFPDPTSGHVPNRTPFRHWGLLNQSQFEELVSEFFNIQP